MVDDVQSFVAAAEVLKESGAIKIYILATHGLLSSDAPRLIEESPIDEVLYCERIFVIETKSTRRSINCASARRIEKNSRKMILLLFSTK